MTLLDRMSNGVTTAVTRPAVVRRHLTGVEGLEHLPGDGPFVLVCNHVSFADHFFHEALLYAVRGHQGAFLTKAESFRGPRAVWFTSMGALPVDRDRPGRDLLEVTAGALRSGRPLIVYPEGTRNRGAGLLPFKDGAFRFADRADVPVIPAALLGTQEILPVGATVPRRRRARVAYGPPLTADASLGRAARIRDLTERGRAAVEQLASRLAAPTAERDAAAAERTAALADALLERTLSGTDTQPAALRFRQAGLLLDAALSTDPRSPAARLCAARRAGLLAMDSRSPAAVLRLRQVRNAAEQVLAEHPDQLMAHYLLGRWHLATPRLLGGDLTAAVHHLAAAERLGGQDSRYAMAHAEALETAGRGGAATAAYAQVVAAPAPDDRTRAPHSPRSTVHQSPEPAASPASTASTETTEPTEPTAS
ncbi:1-acyl-sn-glycerol-3-phosphate acyltransferase, partial [Streptomyces spiramenti]|nr:1-acyl-sn-glycerol-3-phosphate acyltransferase [Streptomyces spiramenti]